MMPISQIYEKCHFLKIVVKYMQQVFAAITLYKCAILWHEYLDTIVQPSPLSIFEALFSSPTQISLPMGGMSISKIALQCCSWCCVHVRSGLLLPWPEKCVWENCVKRPLLMEEPVSRTENQAQSRAGAWQLRGSEGLHRAHQSEAMSCLSPVMLLPPWL